MMTLKQLMATFPTEEKCREYIFDHRWPNGVRCARCGNERVYKLKRPGCWQCAKCSKTGYRFTLLTGTIFENTKYPLTTWFQVLYTMLNSKKGVSALQIHRQIGSGSYQTAWYLCHRLRAAMQDADFLKLMGIVEVDETFIGGKDKNRHWKKKSHVTGGSGKIGVIGAISRKGNVVCKVIENTDGKTLTRFVRNTVSDQVQLVATDDNPGYDALTSMGYKHKSVRHSQHEYVRSTTHTSNIDNFWSLLKRGIIGTYHNVSKEYLPLYLAEFQFRFNNRNNEDICATAVSGC
jgi:transposase-like protein